MSGVKSIQISERNAGKPFLPRLSRGRNVFFFLFLSGGTLFSNAANAAFLNRVQPRIEFKKKSSSKILEFFEGNCAQATLSEKELDVITRMERENTKNEELTLKNITAFELNGRKYVLFDDASAVYVVKKEGDDEVVAAIGIGSRKLIEPNICGEKGNIFFKGKNTGTTFYLLDVNANPPIIRQATLIDGKIMPGDWQTNPDYFDYENSYITIPGWDRIDVKGDILKFEKKKNQNFKFRNVSVAVDGDKAFLLFDGASALYEVVRTKGERGNKYKITAWPLEFGMHISEPRILIEEGKAYFTVVKNTQTTIYSFDLNSKEFSEFGGF